MIKVIFLALLSAIFVFVPDTSAADPVLVRIRGNEFSGGSKDLFGEIHHDVWGVNYVYARPTGGHSKMEFSFNLHTLPQEELFLYLLARDDNSEAKCPVEIKVNGKTVFEGKNEFPSDAWSWKAYPLSDRVLQEGENKIVIANMAEEGQTGNPPWFMLGHCLIGEKDIDPEAPANIKDDFRVDLPEEIRTVPEPYEEDEPFKGFQFRGTKGWLWTPEQYLAEIPILAKYRMNFLMNCYGSMCDIENYGWGDPNCNRWWEPLPAEKKAAFEEIVRECQANDIHFCFSMNPNLCSSRPLDYESEKDFEDLWKQYEWMQDLGVKWFNVSLDDITRGIDASGQANVVNRLFARLRERDPDVQFIFTPTHYWGSGKDDPYLDTLARDLHKDVYIFWTGDQVVSVNISGAQSYREAVGHRLFLWDNYPVNDALPTLHLGPVVGRNPKLYETVDGYMSNPMHSQNEINRLPLITCADYAYNPEQYDPGRSIGQAIVHLAETDAQRTVLKDLVELYPGQLVLSSPGCGHNPVIVRFNEFLRTPHSRFLARIFIDHVRDVASRMESEFPDRFIAARKTVFDDVEKMEASFKTRYGE